MDVKNKRIQKLLTFTLLGCLVVLIAIMALELIPVLKEVISNKSDESITARYIESVGVKGVFLLFFMQLLSGIVFVVPSFPIEVLSGLCYGAVWGTLISVSGYAAGQTILFFLIRRMSIFLDEYLKRRTKSKKKSAFDFIKDTKNPGKIELILYAIPLLPNGSFPYLFAQTKIGTIKFGLLVMIGSIPNMLVATIFGSRLSSKDLPSAGIILAIVLLLVAVFFIFKNRLIDALKKNFGN